MASRTCVRVQAIVTAVMALLPALGPKELELVYRTCGAMLDERM
jgi:hypothetical protein